MEYLVLEDFKSTDTGPYTPWSMERNCSDECRNFCVTMGGRTKLTYCTSCCTTNLCNIDNSVEKVQEFKLFYFILSHVILILFKWIKDITPLVLQKNLMKFKHSALIRTPKLRRAGLKLKVLRCLTNHILVRAFKIGMNTYATVTIQ